MAGRYGKPKREENGVAVETMNLNRIGKILIILIGWKQSKFRTNSTRVEQSHGRSEEWLIVASSADVW